MHILIKLYKHIDDDNKKHKVFCKSGKWNLEPHSFTHMFKSGNELLGDCNKCGATVVYMTF